jgi:ATP-dependent DNA helicase PIF1
MSLSFEQELALEKFKKGENLFITGPGGTGKTYLIKEIIKICTDKYQVCALTGCAAILLNCNAKTIHSWSGIKIANGEIKDIVERLVENKYLRKTWRSTKVLIIDEVSMMSKKIFELLNVLAKSMRNNARPFGNMQVIFLGDFYQLPPVSKGNNKEDEQFCFESKDWFDVFPKENNIVLNKIFRQEDKEYINLLMNIRKGLCTEENKKTLEERKICKTNENINAINIYPIKIKVNEVNEKNFDNLNEKQYVSKSEIVKDIKVYLHNDKSIEIEHINAYRRASEKQIDYEINYLLNNCPCENTLNIKKGARIMCIINLDMDNEICNGSQGIVEDIIVKNENISMIKVKFDNGIVKNIIKNPWQSEIYPNIVLYQFPLILAWAITVHKIQGATLDKAIMDIGYTTFEYGQTYVALSRIKSLEGVYLTNFNANKIKANPKVLEFYKTIENSDCNKIKSQENVKIIKL